MRAIPLTQGQWALVDDEDYARISSREWYARWDRNTRSYYAVRSSHAGNKTSHCYMAREVLGTPKSVVDHRNHDTLDNRRENLRLAVNGQNNHNRRLQRNNTSGFKGVAFHRATGKWRAQIGDGRLNKKKWLGLFDSPADAHAAYLEAAKRMYGEFACDGTVSFQMESKGE